MALLTLSLLLACSGESVTFEEAPAPAAEEQAPEGSADEGYEPVTTPENGEQEVVEADAADGRAPARRDNWPPVVIPQDQREREWEWEFEHKGRTRSSTDVRDYSKDELTDIEMRNQEYIDRGEEPPE